MADVAELGRLTKAKYPQYQNMDDAELGRLVRTKYPAYSDYTDVVAAAPVGAEQAIVPAGAEETGLPPPAGAKGSPINSVPVYPKAVESTVGMLGSAPFQMLEGVGGAIRYMGAEQTGKAVTDFGKKYGAPPKWFEELSQSPDKFYDPAFYAGIASQGAGSSLTFFVPGAGAGKVAAAASKLPIGLWRGAAAWAAGTTTSAVFESLADAGSSYNEAVEQLGAKPEIAAQVFTETLKREVPVTMLTNAFGEFLPRAGGSVWKRALQVGLDMVMEGGEEVAQGMAQRSAKNAALGTNTPLLEGAPEEFLGGALGGGLMSGGRAAINAYTRRTDGTPEATADEAPAENIPAAAPASPVREHFDEQRGNLKERAKSRDAAVEAFLEEHPEYRDEVLGPPESSQPSAISDQLDAPRDEDVPAIDEPNATAGVPEAAEAAPPGGVLVEPGGVDAVLEEESGQGEADIRTPGIGEDPNRSAVGAVGTVDSVSQSDVRTDAVVQEVPAPFSPIKSGYRNGKPEVRPVRPAPHKAGEVIPFEKRSAPPDGSQLDNRSDAEKPETTKHEFSSTQVNLPEDVARDVRGQAAAIAEEDLAEDGRETEPHVTVKYGIHGDDAARVRELLADEPPVRVTLGETSLFENEGGDVVKVDVDSPDLHRLNAKIAGAVENTESFPEYKPHVTLGYVKPGRGKKYAGNAALAGREVVIDRIVFSDRNGNRTEIPLGGKSGQPSAISDQPAAVKPTRQKKLKAESRELKAVAAEVQPTLPKLKQRPFAEAVEAHGRWEAKLLAAQAAGKSTAFIGKMLDKHAATLRKHLGENYAGPLTAEEILEDAAARQKIPIAGSPGLFQLKDDEARRIRMRFNRIMAGSIREKPYNPRGGRVLMLKQVRSVARPAKNGEPGIVYLNRQARLALTEIFQSLGHKVPDWAGLAMESAIVPQVMRRLQSEAVEAWSDDVTRNAFSRIHDSFQKAVVKGLPVVLVEAGPEVDMAEMAATRRHEKIHAVQHVLGGGMPAGHIDEKTFLASEHVEIARGRLLRLHYPNDNATITAEIAAWIGSGQWESIGLNEEQALSLFAIYMDLLRGKHGDLKVKPMLRWIFPRLRNALKEKGVLADERTGEKQAGGKELPPPRGGLPEGGQGGSARRVEQHIPLRRKRTAEAIGDLRPSGSTGRVERREQGGSDSNAKTIPTGRRRATSAGVVSADLLASPVLRGVDLLSAGVRTFREWKARLVEEYGPSIKRKALTLWGQAKRLWNDETGTLRLDKLAEWYRDSSIRAGFQLYKAAETRVSNQGDGAGRELMRLVHRSKDEGENLSGMLLVKLYHAKLGQLNRQERWDLLDALEGRIDPAKLDPKVREVFTAARSVTDEIAVIADELDVMVATAEGRRPFHGRSDYFPHVIDPGLLAWSPFSKNTLRRDVIENMVRIKAATNAEEAEGLLDAFLTGVNKGRWEDRLINYLVQTGQAKGKTNEERRADAYAKLKRYRESLTKKQGSLEHAREVNLPFYDPDPARVLPLQAVSQAMRLGQIAEFGQDDTRLKVELRRIREAGGDDAFAERHVRRMLDEAAAAGDDTEGNAVVSFLGMLQTFKMTLSAPRNLLQQLNIWQSGDFPALVVGMRSMFTAEGRAWAIESGASIDPVLHEALRHMGNHALSQIVLKAYGFTPAEQANRIAAANAGAYVAKKLFRKAQKGHKWARSRMEEVFGVDMTEALERGSLSHGDLLMASKKFSDFTQFRISAANKPTFTEHWVGKAMWVFQSFAYNQFRYLARETGGEFKRSYVALKNGDRDLMRSHLARAFRNLLFVGIATPFFGNLMRLLLNWIKGRDEDELETGLQKWFAGLMEAGTLGYWTDLFVSARHGSLEKKMAGPIATDIWELGEILASDKDMDEKLNALKKYAVRRAPFGSVLPRLWPALVE